MEEQKQTWVVEYLESKWWIRRGEYLVSADVIKKQGISFWVRHIKEKNPAWDWEQFEKVSRRLIYG